MLKKFFSSSGNKKKQVSNPAVQNIITANKNNVNSSTHPSQDEQEKKYSTKRIEQVCRLRQALSPEECLLKDGQLDFSYFTEQVNESWKQNRDGKRLLRGIQKHGIGNWQDIQREYFPKFTTIVIELHAKLLLGDRDLRRYEGQKLSNEQIEEIHHSNVMEGEKNGNLQFSLLQDPSLLRLKKKHIQDLNQLYQGKIQTKSNIASERGQQQNKRKYKKRKDVDEEEVVAVDEPTLTLDRFFPSKCTKCQNQKSPLIKQDGVEIQKTHEKSKKKQSLIEEKKSRNGKHSPDIDELTKTNSQDCCPVNVDQ